MRLFAYPAILIAALALQARATSIGTNITIFDGKTSGEAAGSWNYGSHEDNETENGPATILAQDWDLEGMYLNGTKLSLVGGYNFMTGHEYGGYTYKSGDIFISTNGAPLYGSANTGQNTTPGGYDPGSPTSYTTLNTFGYNYVIHFNLTGSLASSTYDVYQIDANTVVTRSIDVATSNPWTYSSGGRLVVDDAALVDSRQLAFSEFSTLSTQGSLAPGLLGNGNTVDAGDVHYVLTVDTSFLPAGSDTYFHYTMECGNDNLMGHTSSVPDAGTTFLLVSLGGALLIAFRRRLGK